MRYLTLFLLLCVLPVASAQVFGNSLGAFAVGKWKESREGVSLHCTRDTFQTIKDGVCFLTEVQATAKDTLKMSTNVLTVTSWDQRGLTAHAYFSYATTSAQWKILLDDCVDKNRNKTRHSRGGSCGAISGVIRIVLNFETDQVTKFVEASTGNTVEYHLVEDP